MAKWSPEKLEKGRATRAQNQAEYEARERERQREAYRLATMTNDELLADLDRHTIAVVGGIMAMRQREVVFSLRFSGDPWLLQVAKGCLRGIIEIALEATKHLCNATYRRSAHDPDIADRLKPLLAEIETRGICSLGMILTPEGKTVSFGHGLQMFGVIVEAKLKDEYGRRYRKVAKQDDPPTGSKNLETDR